MHNEKLIKEINGEGIGVKMSFCTKTETDHQPYCQSRLTKSIQVVPIAITHIYEDLKRTIWMIAPIVITAYTLAKKIAAPKFGIY
jgi:hypothetical protein